MHPAVATLSDGQTLWHKHGVTMPRRPRKPRPPLDRERLNELALAYVARFATSRAKLGEYLRRKVRERGWVNDEEPPIAAIVTRLSELGYVDDASFAVSKARSLRSRGYGNRRVAQALGAAGIDGEDREVAMECEPLENVEAALRFARRRRIGPFSAVEGDRNQREKWLAALLRAGHGLDVSRWIVLLPAGIEPEPEQFNG